MQPESTRPKRSLLAKTLCLLALLGAVYVLATGMPTMVTGAFSAVSFMRPAQADRAAGVKMQGGIVPSKPTYFESKLAKDKDRAANLAKAEEQRLAFKQQNPDQEELPGYLPFGEKMVGGRQPTSAEGSTQLAKPTFFELKRDSDENRAANLAKAEEQRLAFKQRNPDNGPLPSYLPFGEKMGGGRSAQMGVSAQDRYKYTYYKDFKE